MSRLLALPVMAVVIGILACGSSATDVLPVSTPASTVKTASDSAPAAGQTLSSGPTVVPAMTALPEPISETGPDSTQAAETAAPALPTSGPTSVPASAPAKAAIIVDQPGIGTDVGHTLPHFEFTLFDGAKRNTAQLSGQGRPVFLFFFATW